MLVFGKVWVLTTVLLLVGACAWGDGVKTREPVTPFRHDSAGQGIDMAPDAHGNVIPDFSSVGYAGGGVPIPDVPVVMTLSPDSEADDRARIQAALDAVAARDPDANGVRGALLLRAGEYRVDGPLVVAASGVVLRGEGQHQDGTTILATGRDHTVRLPSSRGEIQHSLIYMGRLTLRDRSRAYLRTEEVTTLRPHRVPVGTVTVRVEDPIALSAGDTIMLRVIPNTAWLQALGNEDIWAGMLGRFRYERRVIKVAGDNLTLDAPMLFYLEPAHIDRVIVERCSRDDRVRRSGVESLRLVSGFVGDSFRDVRNYREPEKHARSGVHIDAAADCWVRNVTALHFPMSAVEVQWDARHITVQDCAYLRPVSQIEGGRRYAFLVNGTQALVQRCYAREARHAFVSSSVAGGPNVFLDCLAEKNHDAIGPHLKWATGFLYDNVTAPQGRIELRRGKGTHDWQGVNHVLWNCDAAQIICDAPETGDTNWAVGCIGAKRSSPRRAAFGHWISHGKPVQPRSLYLHQLTRARGAAAAATVTTRPQSRDRDAVLSRLKDSLAELDARERANDPNAVSDPWFLIAGRRSPWEVRERGANGIIPVEELQRLDNPRWGGRSAVTIPARHTLYLTPFLFMDPGHPAADEVPLRLTFQVRAQAGTRVYASVSHTAIRTQSDADGYGEDTYGSSRWERLEDAEGHTMDCKEQWMTYAFSFSIHPKRVPETTMPYPTVLSLAIVPDAACAIANPTLVVDREP